jgi:hypothetical protein
MTTKEQRRQEWTARIADYKASGLTMSAWCDAHHVTKEQLKYWLRKLKVVPSEAVTAPTHWVPLTVAVPSNLPTMHLPLSFTSVQPILRSALASTQGC